MLSKNKIKLIRSLDLKKNRNASGLFIAEGKRLVLDLLQSGVAATEVYCTKSLLNEFVNTQPDCLIETIDPTDLDKITFLKSSPEIVAIFKIPHHSLNWDELKNNLSLVLDSIQDPGNLGTIVRLADWFGIKNIICSAESADVYNPKTIQSTMGAFARVKVHYAALDEFLDKAKLANIPIYGAFLEGENLYKSTLTVNGLIVMGNEGNGISSTVETYISRKIRIPNFPAGSSTSESLNVAIATSIICSEFRRRIICRD